MNRQLRIVLAAFALSTTAIAADPTPARACGSYEISEEQRARQAVHSFLLELGLNKQVKSVSVSLDDDERAGSAAVRLAKRKTPVALNLRQVKGRWIVFGS